MDADTAEATAWAKKLIRRKDWVILDTETTGVTLPRLKRGGVSKPLILKTFFLAKNDVDLESANTGNRQVARDRA